MADEANLQKNRVIYNVQDLFFGLVSGEKNVPLVTGDNGEEIEILKRIHRVQSVTYDFQVNRQDIGVLGRASFDESIITNPPDVNVTVTHTLEGLNNETRMGFNVLSYNVDNAFNKEFSETFISGNKQQNIYLAVNQDSDDVREPSRDPSEIYGLINSGRYRELTHPGTDKMGMIVFQNCHANSYSLDVSVGSIPRADTSFIADNVIYLPSSSGQYVPWLDTKTATSYFKKNNKGTNTEFIIPRNYKRSNPNFNVNHSFTPGDTSLTIETRPSQLDTLLRADFEAGTLAVNTPESTSFTSYRGTASNDSSNSYAGTKSLKCVGDSTGAGALVTLPTDKMEVDKYYILEAYVKVDSINPVNVVFSVQDGQGNQNNLSTFKSIKYQDGWVRIQKRAKLDAIRSNFYIYTTTPNTTIWIDEVYLTKEPENPPLKFHTNLMQSFKLNIPLSRENISCVGYKYYADRAVQLPVKTTYSIDMVSQDLEYPVQVEGEDRQGNFLDNLSKDEEYDIYLTFTDSQSAEAMKFRIFGSKFQGVSYGLDINSPKTTTLNFALSNDYDYGRNVIAAEGRGLFVLDVLVNDSLIPLTDDNGNLIGDTYPFNF